MYILRAQRVSHIPTLRPKYTPYSYMDPLGSILSPAQSASWITLRNLRTQAISCPWYTPLPALANLLVLQKISLCFCRDNQHPFRNVGQFVGRPALLCSLCFLGANVLIIYGQDACQCAQSGRVGGLERDP